MTIILLDHLTAPIDFWRNFPPLFGEVALFTTDIDNFREQSQEWKLPQKDYFKTEDELKKQDNLKHKDDQKNGNDPKNEDNVKNKDEWNLKSVLI